MIKKIKLEISEILKDKKKVSYIIFTLSVLLVIFCIGIYAFMSRSTDKRVVENMENPNSEKNLYNTKLDAINKKKDNKNLFGLFGNAKVDSVDNLKSKEDEEFQEDLKNLKAQINTQTTTVNKVNDNSNIQTNSIKSKANDNKFQYTEYYQDPKEHKEIKYYSSNQKDAVDKKNIWINPKYSKSMDKTPKIDNVYKGIISGTRNKYITKSNNRVYIRVIEPFIIKEVQIPKGTILVAYANFDNTLTLSVKSIHKDGKIIPVNIRILDSQGQDALEIIGGLKDQINNEFENEMINDINTGNSLVNKGIKILSKKKTIKAIISSDNILMKIENE